MANVLIRDLIEATSLDPDDLLEVNVDPSGTPLSRKAKLRVVSPWVLIDDTTISSPVASVTHQFDPSLYAEVISVSRGVTVDVDVSSSIAFVAALTPFTGTPEKIIFYKSRADSSDITGASSRSRIVVTAGNGVSGAVLAQSNFVDSQDAGDLYGELVDYDSLDSTGTVTLTYKGLDTGTSASRNLEAGRFTTYGLRLP